MKKIFIFDGFLTHKVQYKNLWARIRMLSNHPQCLWFWENPTGEG